MRKYRVFSGASADFNNATVIATEMVKSYGMSEKVGVRTVDFRNKTICQTTGDLVDAEIKRLLQVSFTKSSLTGVQKRKRLNITSNICELLLRITNQTKSYSVVYQRSYVTLR